jgi:hypothetical protein
VARTASSTWVVSVFLAEEFCKANPMDEVDEVDERNRLCIRYIYIFSLDVIFLLYSII